MDTVILTDEHGTEMGTMEKRLAHEGNGTLHKAFSIFIFRNNREELLLQKRSEQKMLFGGYWANTCCSHPRNGEELIQVAMERLQEECGFTSPLHVIGSFIYHAADPRGHGAENEYDTVLVGEVEDIVLAPNPEEIAEMKWMSVAELQKDLEQHPELYAPWLQSALALIPLAS